MPLAVIVVIMAVFPLVAGYIVLVERKVLADFQVRLGPMRVGPHGLLQPIADALKLLLKEDIIPTDSDQAIFWFAPVISTFTGLTAFAVLPFAQNIYVADVNVGLLVVSAMSAVGILGIILGGWSSNSHYPLLGALRSAAQLVSYEVALSFALLSGVMAAGTLSMQGIVKAQLDRGVWFVFDNYFFMIVPFAVYIIAATAETNRAPVRPAGGRIRTGGRLPHRVQRLPLGALLPGRIRQHLRGLVGGRHAVLGRLAAAVPQRGLAGHSAEHGLPGAAVRRIGCPHAYRW